MVQIGPNLRVRLVAKDPRCAITTLDPETGERDFDVPRLVLSYRPSDRAAYFGVYGAVESTGTEPARHPHRQHHQEQNRQDERAPSADPCDHVDSSSLVLGRRRRLQGVRGKRDLGQRRRVGHHDDYSLGKDRLPETPRWADTLCNDLDGLVGRLIRHGAATGAFAAGDTGVQRALKEAGRATHDLNQPLMIITSRSRMLLKKMDEADPSRRGLEIIADEAERLARTAQRFEVLLPYRRRK